MSTTPLTTNFKDDILASSNPKRKYQIIYNDDGTVCLEDVTVYSQTGSTYGAKEVNEERAAINNIDERRIVTLDEIDLVTEEGFFVDALAVAELNKKCSDTGWYDVFGDLCKVRRKNGIITVIGTCSDTFGLTKDYRALTTLPSAYRPDILIPFTGNGMGGDNHVFGKVGTDGIIYLYSTANTNYWNYSFSYPATD